jgi:death on curing protein
MDGFIRSNGYRLNLSPQQAYELVIQVAQSDISKEALTELLGRTIVLNGKS